MKTIFKTSLLGFFFFSALASIAQVDISVSGAINLETIDKLKGGWKMVKAGQDDKTKESYIMFGKPNCAITIEKGYLERTTIFHGVKWEIDKLFFNDKFELQRNELTEYATSLEATMDKVPVWGEYFWPKNSDRVGFIGEAKSIIQGVAAVQRALTADYMGKVVVTGAQAQYGCRIIRAQIYPTVAAGDNGLSCSETPTIGLLSSVDSKEKKGQMWYPIYNSTEPNGGNLLFVTTGVNPDLTKHHWVFRKYDQDANIVKELVLPFDYLMAMSFFDEKGPDGKTDFMLVIHPSGYKAKGSKIPLSKDPLQLEYIRIDGESLTIKERFFFKSNYSSWASESLYIDPGNGDVYIAGPASNKNDDLSPCINSINVSEVETPMAILKTSKNLPNYQVVKISGGKVEYVSGITTADATNNLKIAPEEKGNTKPVFIFNFPVSFNVKNNKLIINFQQTVGPSDRDAMVTMVVGGSGKLEGYYLKPEKTYSLSNSFFSADGNSMYWAIYDCDLHNKLTGELGAMGAKTTNFIVYGLSIMKIDLIKNEIVSYKTYGDGQYGIAYPQPVLYDTPDETVLIARNLDKKAKDSEMMFVKIKK